MKPAKSNEQHLQKRLDRWAKWTTRAIAEHSEKNFVTVETMHRLCKAFERYQEALEEDNPST